MSSNEKLANFVDAEIYEEAARRIQALIEKTVGKKLTFGSAVFQFHNGRFWRIECQPSLRAYVKSDTVEVFI